MEWCSRWWDWLCRGYLARPLSPQTIGENLMAKFGYEDDKRSPHGDDEDRSAKGKKRTNDVKGGFDNLFGMGGFSNPGNKVGGKLDKKLGPANDPLSGIIQGLAFNNPKVKGSDKFSIDMPDFKPTNLYPGANVNAPSTTGLEGFLPKESNFLRSFIYSLMQRNMGRR